MNITLDRLTLEYIINLISKDLATAQEKWIKADREFEASNKPHISRQVVYKKGKFDQLLLTEIKLLRLKNGSLIVDNM